MALTATIFKAQLNVSDLDRGHYETYPLTLARHPSETDERMMIRLLAFALFADDDLGFTRGLSSNDEPDLWKKNYSGEVDLWIEIGQPDERRIRKACSLADKVIVICYGGRAAGIWWQQNQDALKRFDNLQVLNIPVEDSKALAGLAEKNMQLHCTLQEGQVFIGNDKLNLTLVPELWRKPD